MRPGPRLLWFIFLWGGVALAVSFVPPLAYLWYGLGTALVAITLYEYLQVRKPIFSVERTVPNPIPVGEWCTVICKLIYEGDKKINVTFFDHHPHNVEVKGIPCDIVFHGMGEADIEYQIRANERGTIQFHPAEILVRGVIQVANKSFRAGEEDEVKVYPNFKTVAGYAMLAAENRVAQMGILKKRRRGEGLDFHQLRPYRVGDAMRQIDWKATSRTKKLISKDYQEERDQQVVFLLDCGRRMNARDGDLSHFDHTLNSLLLMTYVALRQGDSVGLMTFAGEERRWLSPRKGEHRLNEVMNMIYDLQPSNHGSDYSSAASQLMVSLKKRALVVVLSNLRDEDSDDIIPAIHLLKKNHLVLFASLQEVDVNKALEQEVHSLEHALNIAATHSYLQNRRKAHEELAHRRVVTVDVEPQDLPIALVNRYLEIKASQML